MPRNMMARRTKRVAHRNRIITKTEKGESDATDETSNIKHDTPVQQRQVGVAVPMLYDMLLAEGDKEEHLVLKKKKKNSLPNHPPE